MISPEQLINDLQNQVVKLETELTQAHQDIKDFEEAAHHWKDGFEEMERSYRIKLANAYQIIEELEKEIKVLTQELSP